MPDVWMPTHELALSLAHERARITGRKQKVTRGRKLAGWFIKETSRPREDA